MKLRNILAATTAASLAFLAVSRRETIAKEAKEIKQLLTDMTASKRNIEEQLAIIQGLQKPIQELATDFQYKVRVYQQSIAGNLEEIQKIQARYQGKNNDSEKILVAKSKY